MQSDLFASASLESTVECDGITKEISNAFDFPFTGTTRFVVPDMGKVPDDFSIGLIVGSSGSGKSTLLRSFGSEPAIEWDPSKAVCSHFSDASEARSRLSAVGLNSIPSWLKPFHVLSTGERFRAEMARKLCTGAVIDEFTSVVDRAVAKSCARAISRFIREQRMQRVVFASCHYDIVEWLQPDWVFDTSNGRLTARGSERQPEIRVEIEPCSSDAWALFRDHHYLSADINRASRCWVASWDGIAIGFTSALHFPNGNLKNAYREHRTVVLPDYQGLGIGVRLSDCVGEMVVRDGNRYFSKTAHPRMGEYRNRSPLWKATSKNNRTREDYAASRTTIEQHYKMQHASRLCYSHEYVGAATGDCNAKR